MFVSGARGLWFKSRVDQIEHSVPTARYRYNISSKKVVLLGGMSGRSAPSTRYTLRWNTASIMKDLICRLYQILTFFVNWCS